MEDQPLEEQLAKITLTSVAIAGSGEAADETLAALLDDQLPQKLGAVYRPIRIPRRLAALSSAISFLESPDMLGDPDEPDKNFTVGTDDIIASLLARREEGDIIELYVLWPEEPDEDELKLVKAAFDNGIRVRNLSAMLKDLDPDEVFPPEPEPEATPAEAAADEAVEDTVEAVTEAATQALEPVLGQLASAIIGNLELFIRRVVRDELGKNGGVTAADVKTPTAAQAVAAVVEPPFDPPFVPERSDGPVGSAEKAPGKVKYFYDKSKDRYRVAKFRPKTGEETVYLDEEEIGAVVRAGLVDD
jgi:hypothetical protein